MYPRLVIDLNKLRHNAETLCAIAQKQGITDLAFVTKVFCADSEMVQTLLSSPCRYLADSRVENLARYPQSSKERILLRLPMPSQAEQVVKHADISFNSEIKTLQTLSAAAEKLGKPHKVVLMIDMGDLREGVFYKNTDLILQTAKMIEKDPFLILYGTAFNLTCYGSVLPSEENISAFLSVTRRIEEQIGRRLDFISGGNSSSIPLLLQGENSFGVNNLRLGESLILGRETAYGADLKVLYQDVVTLEAELVEVQEKPSYPEGQIGVNAFGEAMQYTDIGIRRRAIAAIGRQDMECTGLVPLDPGVSVVGASSDHLILDITDSEKPLEVGDRVRFTMDYAGLLKGFTSSYIDRYYL